MVLALGAFSACASISVHELRTSPATYAIDTHGVNADESEALTVAHKRAVELCPGGYVVVSQTSRAWASSRRPHARLIVTCELHRWPIDDL